MKKPKAPSRDIVLLAKDFRAWGRKETRLVQRGVKKYGVVFDEYVSSDNKG